MLVILIIVAILIIAAILVSQDFFKKSHDIGGETSRSSSNRNNQKIITEYDFDIVGEQSYQQNLARISGQKELRSKHFECSAIVISEPSNRFDKNAIRVEINGLIVGYIPKEKAKKLSRYSVRKTVPALINGGWKDDYSEGNYGVKLAIDNLNELTQ